MADKNFDYLGETFQLQLLNQIILDKDFSHSIIEVIESTYFENKYFRLFVQMVKEYYSKFEHSPSFETIQQKAKSEISQELLLKITLDTISDIQNVTEEGTQFVQEKALKFCKQQELKKLWIKLRKSLTTVSLKTTTPWKKWLEELYRLETWIEEREMCFKT